MTKYFFRLILGIPFKFYTSIKKKINSVDFNVKICVITKTLLLILVSKVLKCKKYGYVNEKITNGVLIL